MTAIDTHELDLVVGGGWGISLQGQTPIRGGHAQGGFRVGLDGVGIGVQGQRRLPSGDRIGISVRIGSFPLPDLPTTPSPASNDVSR
jgi:hypothetical protein